MTAGSWAAPLLERNRELEQIEAALARARAGSGSLLVIEGAAGEGKSTLLAVARDRADGVELTAVDDAQRLDGQALRGLVARAQELAGRPEVLLVAFRPQEPGADESGLDELRTAFGASRVTLAPLGATSVAELVRERRPGADDELCRAVHESTGGNPLYVEELLAGDPARTHLISVGDRVLRRAAAIADGAAALAMAVAVLGDGERLSLAAEVAEIPVDGAQAIAHRMRRMGILASEDPVVFAQPLVRRSIYHSLPDAERHANHNRAARALREAGRPLGAVAEHLAALIPTASSAVAAGLAAAAEAAPESSHAIRWLRRALEEGAVEPPRVELLQRLGNVELVARDSAAIGHLTEALELTTEPATRARMGIWLAETLAYAGQWDEMMAVMSAVELDVGADTEEVRVQFASVRAAATAYDAARVHVFDRERAHLEELSHGASWPAHALTALLASISAQRGEPPENVQRTAERAIEDGTLLAEQGGGGWAAPQLIGAFILTEATDRAMALCDEVEAASRQAGAITGSLLASGYRGWILARGGDLIRAEAEFRRTLALIPDHSMQMIAATFYFTATDLLLERPSLAHVKPAIEATRLEPAFLDTWSGAMHLWTRGRLRLANGNRVGGVEDLRAVGKIAAALQVGPALAPWRSALALALSPRLHEEAVALVEDELILARASTLTRPEGVALRALGLLTPSSAGIDLLRSAVEVLAGSPARLELARALVTLGAALRRGRRGADAREPLHAGLELATSCGAVTLAARARDELNAAAGRTPRREVSDRSLTPSELRVARLAVAGASNRDIADDLFVSLKTVETHLSHAYAKLGLMGRGARDELGTALAAYGPL